jgi:hypothetical protein
VDRALPLDGEQLRAGDERHELFARGGPMGDEDVDRDEEICGRAADRTEHVPEHGLDVVARFDPCVCPRLERH